MFIFISSLWIVAFDEQIRFPKSLRLFVQGNPVLHKPINPFRPATRRQQAKRVFSIYSLLLSDRDQFFTAEFF